MGHGGDRGRSTWVKGAHRGGGGRVAWSWGSVVVGQHGGQQGGPRHWCDRWRRQHEEGGWQVTAGGQHVEGGQHVP